MIRWEKHPFVGEGLRGPLFWATYNKKQLERQDGVSRMVNSGDWVNNALDYLLGNNPIAPKRTLSVGVTGFP